MEGFMMDFYDYILIGFLLIGGVFVVKFVILPLFVQNDPTKEKVSSMNRGALIEDEHNGYIDEVIALEKHSFDKVAVTFSGGLCVPYQINQLQLINKMEVILGKRPVFRVGQPVVNTYKKEYQKTLAELHTEQARKREDKRRDLKARIEEKKMMTQNDRKDEDL
jgi:hypothetical protein